MSSEQVRHQSNTDSVSANRERTLGGNFRNPAKARISVLPSVLESVLSRLPIPPVRETSRANMSLITKSLRTQWKSGLVAASSPKHPHSLCDIQLTQEVLYGKHI